MPTTPLGLPYPASTDAPRVWQDIQSLATAADTAIGNLGKYGTNFLPTFTAGFGAFGTGFTRVGWYTIIGKTCFWNWRIEFGATGTPAFNAEVQWNIGDVGLPYLDNSPVAPGLNTMLGSWSWRSNASGLRHYGGQVGLFSVGSNTAFLGGAFDGTAHRVRLGSASAITAQQLANSDVLAASGAFRLAD